MARYETLMENSKDRVNCYLPGIATNFGITDVIDVIPADIRMRQWDCNRKDHVKEKQEDDPRNWGLQFLQDLVTISRIKQGKLEEFQTDLRNKVQQHDSKHPWAKLADIKDLRYEYETPGKRKEKTTSLEKILVVSSDSSDDSYFEELLEKESVWPKKRCRKPKNEYHDASHQKASPHKRKFYLVNSI
jgi:hypothetical protein